jgi:hypothetical protein
MKHATGKTQQPSFCWLPFSFICGDRMERVLEAPLLFSFPRKYKQREENPVRCTHYAHSTNER